jgi:hypothetical protein
MKYDPKNYIDKKYGILTVIGIIKYKKDKTYRLICQCNCGNKCELFINTLLAGQKSCGCLKKQPDIDLTGKTIDKLLIKKYLGTGQWECECLNCGNKNYIAKTGDLNRGKIHGCGCMIHQDRYENFKNMKFNHLTVLNEPPIRKGHTIYWKCLCDCGNSDIIEVRASHLKSGGIKSCGCLLTYIEPNIYDLSNEYGIGYLNRDRKFLFDLEDYDKIKKYRWYTNGLNYVMTKKSKTKSSLLIHRVILNYFGELSIDHINRNPLDNRKLNLRICTASENCSNQSISKRNKFGIMGIVETKSMKKRWSANISINRKMYRLGNYANFEDAVRARLTKELEIFGNDFAPQRHLFKQYGIIDND